MSHSSCPGCHKALPVEGAAFCPFCGAHLAQVEAPPPQAQRYLDQAARLRDPVQKHELLLKARQDCPGCLAVEWEILHLGRLHERSAKHPTYDVIKCYLLHFYLTPGDFSPSQTAAMRAELFEDEQLQRCQALAPDPDAFTREYLQRLSDEFIQLFLEGSTRYTNSIFGISLSKNMPKLMAPPAAKMLAAISGDEALSPERRAMLASAFGRAFAARMGNQTDYLRQELEGYGLPLPL